MTPPTYERAQKSLDSADSILELAQESDDEILKDEFYRVAFNRLFDAARHAVMAYLNTENARWGQLRRALPKPYDERFQALSIRYIFSIVMTVNIRKMIWRLPLNNGVRKQHNVSLI